MENETPLYSTVLYKVRQVLDISWNEYIYLDMVQKLHIHRPWCSKSLEKCSKDLGMSKFGLMKMRDRLIEEGLLEKNDKGHLRVTPKYTEVAVNKVYQAHKQGVNKVDESANLVDSVGQLSTAKTPVQNNNRTTLELGDSLKKKLQDQNPSLFKKLYGSLRLDES